MEPVLEHKICSLPAALVNQISAGEVVESPAHAIKEVVENSIDSGATAIEVQIFDSGGLHFRVKDNGCGITKQDLPLAIKPHATSKISNVNDLWSISTFGFRGEALASLSSVSQFKMVSKAEGAKQAYSIQCKYGESLSVYEAGSEEGTSVEVSHLFQNVPARLKFLKSESRELAKIKDQIKALALANYKIGFKLKSKDKMVFLYPPCQKEMDRVLQVLGQDTLYQSHYQDDIGYKCRAYMCSPEKG